MDKLKIYKFLKFLKILKTIFPDNALCLIFFPEHPSNITGKNREYVMNSLGI